MEFLGTGVPPAVLATASEAWAVGLEGRAEREDLLTTEVILDGVKEGEKEAVSWMRRVYMSGWVGGGERKGKGWVGERGCVGDTQPHKDLHLFLST